jgi:hypothetical protein
MPDEAIRGTLKAPSSYKRVKADQVTTGYFRIEYDAVNAFNAPLRGTGTCTYDTSTKKAVWLELPR